MDNNTIKAIGEIASDLNSLIKALKVISRGIKPFSDLNSIHFSSQHNTTATKELTLEYKFQC